LLAVRLPIALAALTIAASTPASATATAALAFAIPGSLRRRTRPVFVAVLGRFGRSVFLTRLPAAGLVVGKRAGLAQLAGHWTPAPATSAPAPASPPAAVVAVLLGLVRW
jgi:hypothetical protein